jgi:WD40 repeat protein
MHRNNPTPTDHSSDAWKRRESLIERFEQAWAAGQTPRLDDFLADTAVDRQSLLVELIHTDLEYRFRAGRQVQVEEYLERFGELADQDEDLVRLIVAEYRFRCRWADKPDAAEYLHRFPQYAAQLQEKLADQTLKSSGKSAPAAAAARPVAVPGYEIQKELGRGGMGVVYLARQEKLNRLVALKMIRAGGHADEQDRQRFLAEAEAVARLQHPNIVTLHEFGEHNELPYFTLEYVAGGSLHARLREGPLPPRTAAPLVELLARGIDYAHQHGIIHRDLKPANILLQKDEGRRMKDEDREATVSNSSFILHPSSFVPKITDFGLVKRVTSPEGSLTASGAVLGTPSYMAPEQARGEAKRVGPAADIYALGAILYECLTGRPPFQGPTSMDTLWQVLNEEPVPPSRLQPKVPRDLETICLKCLQKAPGQRYGRAADLAEDLRRFAAHEPILARPAPAWRRLGKWARRRPALAMLGVVSLLALLSLLVSGLLWNAQLQLALGDAHEAQEEAATQRAVARQARTEGEAFRTEAEREKVAGKALRQQAQEIKTQAEAKLDQASRILFATQLADVNTWWQRDPGRALELLNDPQRCPVYLRDFTWGYYHRLCKRDRLTLPGNSELGQSPAFAPHGTTLALGGSDGLVRLVDTATGQNRELRHPGSAPVLATAYAPNGQTLACADAAGVVYLWDLQGPRLRATLKGHQGPVMALAFSEDSRTLVSGGGPADDKGEVRLWDAVQGTALEALPGPMKKVTALALPAEGKTLAVATWQDGVTLWDLPARRPGQPLPLNGLVAALAYAPDGKELAAACADGLIHLIDPATGKQRATLQGNAAGVYSVAYLPDGQTLAAGYESGPIMLWDRRGKTVRANLRGHAGRVYRLACSADGRRLAARDQRGGVKVWDLGEERVAQTLIPVNTAKGALKQLLGKVRPGMVGPSRVHAIAFAPGGRQLASDAPDHSIFLWDAETGKREAILPAHPGGISALAYHPQGRLLASAGYAHRINLYDLKSQQIMAVLEGHTGPVDAVAFSPDGRTLASASWDGTVRFWDAAQAREQSSTSLGKQLTSLAYAPDGKTLAVTADDGTVRLLDPLTRQVRRTLSGHHGWASAVAYSADGRWLASADGEGHIQLWDAATGERRLRWQGRRAWIYSLVFAPDGRALASGSGGWEDVSLTSGVVTLWDPVTGKERASWREHTAPVQTVAFADTGRLLASASWDGTVRLWRADPYPR